MPMLAKRSGVCVFQSKFSGFEIACGLLVCLVALCICVPSALAQSASTGALAGTVTDPSGAVIAGASVTATSLATGQSRTATTDANGLYKFSLLPPGNYSVNFSAKGFKTIEVPSTTVNVTETVELDRSLEIGAQTQEVTVSSTAVTLQTENATVGGLVSGATVTNLPLSTRNFTQVIDLSPGVVANVATATAVGNGTMDINVNGSGSDQNTYMMDGVVTTNYGSGGAAQSGSYAGIPIPNPDSIQEFKVQTSQYDAAYGQNPGANVNVVTKSGTNQFHGAAWEFNRNNIFNANDFFYKNSENNERLPNKPPTVKQNQFGGTFGGPIKKDRIFFFGSYQGTRQLNGIGSNGFATAITSVGLLPFNEPSEPGFPVRSQTPAQTLDRDTWCQSILASRAWAPAQTAATFVPQPHIGRTWDARLQGISTCSVAQASPYFRTDPTSVTRPSISCGRRRKFHRSREDSTTAITFPACVITRAVCPSAWPTRHALYPQQFRKPRSPMKIST